MNALPDHINELKAAQAFSKQAPEFDRLFGTDAIIAYKRERVRAHIHSLQPGTDLLEINCGSGEDALYFAQHDFNVHATDISEGMLKVLSSKINGADHGHVTYELCSFTELEGLQKRGPYDGIYSNFGGLNCTRDLEPVLHSFSSLIKPGGTVTLVVIAPFCAWELLLLFRGKFRTAFRRFFSAKGRKASVEGSAFKCWYHRASGIKQLMENEFDHVGTEGLCSLVPPSYMEGFAEKHPALFSRLCQLERKWKKAWPIRSMGDYYIISFRKK